MSNRDQAERIVQALLQKPDLMAEVQALLQKGTLNGSLFQQYHVEVGRAVEDFRIRQGLRLDWHEPDEAEVTAKVIGNRFDNAMGNWVEQEAINGSYQEMVVEITAGDGKATQDVLHVNLVNLCAIASAYGRLED